MPALHDIIAIVKSHQMTLRNIPEKANRKLRDVARREGKSLNRVALEALERGLGIADEQVEYHDLDDLAGTWVEDPEFDRVIGEIDRVDPELWK
jgi:plasmid stability protein